MVDPVDLRKRFNQFENRMWRSIVVSSQQEFRSKGWNLAGANLLALSVGLANRHYLYVRPRLTLRDFGFVLAPMLIGKDLLPFWAPLKVGQKVPSLHSKW